MAELFGGLMKPRPSIGSKKLTVTASVIAHTAIGVVLVVASVAASSAMPALRSVLAFDMPVAPKLPDLPAPAPAATTPAPAAVAPAPTAAVVPIEAASTIATNSSPSVFVGATTGVPGAFGTSSVDFGLPPAEAAPIVKPLPVGGQIKPPTKLHDVTPQYPDIARRARVSGIVILEATIGEDGRVTNARVLRSMPLLDQAAIDAVMHWTYTPTLLNGVAVPIFMTVTVTFTLK